MKFPRVIYHGPIKPHSWCRWAVHRVKNANNSTNIRFTGDTGSGKTYCAITMAEIMARMIGRKFTIDNIYFSIRDIISEVANDDPPPGTIFLLDEQQVSGSAKEHQSKKNKAYGTFMSTVRSKRYIFLSTLPFADMSDKQVRRLFHVEIETAGINKTEQTVHTKPRFLEHSRIRDKVYRKRLVVSHTDPKTNMKVSHKIGTWDIPKPSKDLIELFELKKAAFQKKLYKDLERELDDYETAKDINVQSKARALASEFTEASLTPYQQCIMKYLKQGIRVQRKIAELIKNDIDPTTNLPFNSNPAKLCANIRYMKKKGVILIK